MFTKGTLIYIAQRLVLIAFTVVAVSSVVFVGIHRLPGDALLSERLRGQAYELLVHHYGLDQPLLVQYWNFAVGVITRGDLGESPVNRGLKIPPLVLHELSVSAEVGGLALVFTIGLGLVLGIFAAVRQNTWLDYVLTTTSVIGYSMPNFVIAAFLILVFGAWLQNVPGGAVI